MKTLCNSCSKRIVGGQTSKSWLLTYSSNSVVYYHHSLNSSRRVFFRRKRLEIERNFKLFVKAEINTDNSVSNNFPKCIKTQLSNNIILDITEWKRCKNVDSLFLEGTIYSWFIDWLSFNVWRAVFQQYSEMEQVQQYIYITDLICYTIFHWFFNHECQHIYGLQNGIYVRLQAT